ncbi:MAG: DmsE family decaheme c-type cytochrome [Planctomycetes bacterium]|nr:DmsE family decaheme c-type cytochrome [Planctomycetota bacterium]
MRKRFGLILFVAVVPAFLALWACSQKPIRTRIALPDATNIGSNKCIKCHQDQANAIEKTRHWAKEDPRTPNATNGCESCHGPGSVHAQNRLDQKNDVDNIRFGDKSPFPAVQQSEQCLKCHTGQKSNWHVTKHIQNDVSCANCHKIHGQGEKQLKNSNQLELCGSCHKDKRLAMEKTSHHPVREGKMGCTSCHDPHGTGSSPSIKASSTNDLCYKCHTEKRGPQLFPHPPVAEDCALCHNPHGSIYNKLLKVEPPYLCQRCHSNSRHPGTLYSAKDTFTGTTPSNRMFAGACLHCHQRIHGSNHPSGKMYMR